MAMRKLKQVRNESGGCSRQVSDKEGAWRGLGRAFWNANIFLNCLSKILPNNPNLNLNLEIKSMF